MTLSNQTALVTGGGTGIGLGIARALAARGCKVAIAGRREDILRQAAGSSLLYHTVDVADRDSVQELFDWAEKELGPIDILVQSAGTNIKNRSMGAMQPEDWERLIAINATGAYYCMHAVLPQMRARKSGLIVNISSVAGKRASALGGVAYAASKFAVSALSAAVANEENAHGIRITNVCPGEVNTPILENRPTPVSEEHRAAILQPEDVGELVAAICELPPRAHVAEVIIKPTRQDYF